MIIYLAGKINKTGWRHDIVKRLRKESVGIEAKGNIFEEFPILRKAIFDEHDYAGPYFIGCDHGCFHGHGDHGWGLDEGKHTLCYRGYVDRCTSERKLAAACLKSIKNSNVIFAYINSSVCHGTLIEIGYAKTNFKRIWVFFETEELAEEVWFARALAERVAYGSSKIPDPKSALYHFLYHKRDYFAGYSTYKEYLESGHWQNFTKNAKEYYDNKCQECGKTKTLNTHHRSYYWLGAERMRDVRVLCYECHQKKHGTVWKSRLK